MPRCGWRKSSILSRTLIREAMVRPAAEGLLDDLPNRNTIVAPIDFINLPVYFEALTLMAASPRAAAVHRRPEHLVRIRPSRRLMPMPCDAVMRWG